MYKRMKRCLSLCLTLCILMMAMPSIGLSEDGAAAETAPAAAETTPAAAETTPAAAETAPAAAETTPVAAETTPAAAETTPAAVETTPAAAETTPAAAETTPAPTPVIVELTGAPEAMEAIYGLYEDELDLPEMLTAVYSDGARAELPVTWVCISDGLGGTAYDSECENYEQACFTFEARLPEGVLCAEDLTLPRVQVRLVLPDLGIALYTAADEVTITNTNGVLSYTAPEGVTVKEQQWLKNGSPISGATGLSYTLTMDDMKNRNNVLSVRLTLEDGSTVTSVGYAMSENGQWVLEGSALRFTKDYAQNTTGFPLDYNGIGVTNLHMFVESGMSVSGVTLTCVALQNYGTITDSTLEIKEELANFGTIYGCEFPNSGVAHVPEAGILHVPVTINGTVYKSKPGDSLQFLYDENTYEALTSWYEANCGTYEPEYVHFLYNDGQNTRVTDDKLLGLSNSFNVPYCTIVAPDGFVSGATVSASVQPAIYNSLDYYWYAGSTSLGYGSTAVLPNIDPGASARIELYVSLNMTLNGVPEVDLPIHATAYFSGIAYDVAVNYEGDSLVITPRDGVTIDSAAAESGNLTIAGSSDGSSWTVPLSDCGDDFDVRLYVYSNGKQLAGPTSLHLTRANGLGEQKVDVDIPESGAPRDVTVRWDSASTLDFRLEPTGEIYKKKSSGDTIPVSGGENVTLYARASGSTADKLLPSAWSQVATIDATDWLHLNVTSEHTIGSGDALFWGEVLKIEASEGAVLTWKIDGADVDAPALADGKYTIPADVSSLSITATDATGSITRNLSVSCPVSVRVDLESEEVVLQRVDGCTADIGVHFGGEGATGDGTLNDGSEKRWPVNPTGSAQTLLIDLSYGNVSHTIRQILPPRFTGSASYGSISYDNPNKFDVEFGAWMNITITTEDSDSVKYAAVKLVNSYGDISCSRDSSDKWVPSVFGGLYGGQTYSIYARQYSVVNGVRTTFASDWFDTGVRIKPGEIVLSTYTPLVGDTITATPKFNVPDQNVVWGWNYYLGTDGTPADVTDSNSFTILPGSGYENRRLKVRLYYSTIIMGYAETEVIPEAQIVIRREDGTELAKDAGGYYIAYLGDKLTAEVANVSQTFLKDASDSWTWVYGNGQYSMSSSLELDKDSFRDITYCDVSVDLTKGTDKINLSRRLKIYVAPAPEVKIDYENETLYAVKPDNDVLADYHLRVQSKDGDQAISEGENNVYTIPITDLSSGWPGGRAHELDAFWECTGKTNSESVTFTIPARPAVKGLTIDPAAFAITVKNASTQAYNLRLTAANAASQDADAVAEPIDSNGNVKFTGLESNTTYKLWVQKKATDSAFRSEWTSFDVKTLAAAELVPSLDWEAAYNPTGFSLSAEDVLNHVTFAEKSTGLKVMIERGSVTLTRADGKPFPITDAGTYSLKLTLNGDPADYCELSTDTVTLTVQPYEVSSFDFAGRVTYRGAAYDPYDFEVRVGERVLTKDDYTITVDGGATLRDVGEYTAHIAFKGNFTGSLDGEVHPVIEPFTLRATATPLSREYDGTVSVECSADWDNCEPFAGDDVAVKASGTMADASAGSGKTVAIALALEGSQSGNYVLAGTSLTGSVNIAKAKAPEFRLPAASRIVYGQALSESAITGGDDIGSFAWEDGSIVPPAGLNTCNVVLTPDDTDNYAWTQEMLVQAIEIIVDQRIANLTVENASKTYGDADPAMKLSVTNVLDGDSLDYSISRREGEDVGQYSYSVEEGNNPNYKLNLLLGTLTIEPRSIADGSVSISAVSRQTYTGREIRPQPTLCFGDAVLVPGTDYVLSNSNNVKPGRATITITGKGNFSGSRSVSFTIKEKAPAATATPAPSIAPISDEALQAYLNGMVSLVFDAAYNPVDYEQIPVLVSGEAEENTLLICAGQEEDGAPAQRSLILNAAQLIELQQALQENEIGDLIFENGSAAARMNLAELTGGNVAKLMALILPGGEITEEILQSDWSEMEDAALTEAEYERFSLEVCIVPVVQEDGEQGFEISVWLRCDALNLNVSDLIDSLCVMLDVSSLVTAENAGTFDDLYAIARKNGEESELLDSALVLAPTVSEDGDAAESATPMVIGRYALTALYAGEGMYRIVSVDV